MKNRLSLTSTTLSGLNPARLAHLTSDKLMSIAKERMDAKDNESALHIYDIVLSRRKAQEYYAEIYFQKGEIHYRDKHFTDAIDCFQIAVNHGHVGAMLALASMYRWGDDGKRPRYSKAIALYETAIILGNAQALYELGTLHLNGEGCSVDIDLAISLFTQAGSFGIEDADLLLIEARKRLLEASLDDVTQKIPAPSSIVSPNKIGFFEEHHTDAKAVALDKDKKDEKIPAEGSSALKVPSKLNSNASAFVPKKGL